MGALPEFSLHFLLRKGHYVPQLALQIVTHNLCASQAQAAAGTASSAEFKACMSRSTMLTSSSLVAGGRDDGSSSIGDRSGGSGTSSSSVTSAPSPPVVNLIGLTLGNAWTDAQLDNTGNVDHWWV